MKRLPLLLLLAAACSPAERQSPPQQTSQPAGATSAAAGGADAAVARGRQLAAQYGCGMCHVIPGVEGAQGQLGPTLAGIGSRTTMSGGAVPITPASLAQFVQDPATLNPQTSMPPTGLSDEESHAVAAFLLTLK